MASELETRLLEITEVFVQGDVDEAFARMSELEQSARTDRERSQIMARYATFFHLLELREEELSALAQALILDPANPRANYLNAIHLMADERWDSAIQALNTAARHYPPEDSVHLAEVYGNLSYCWEQLGDGARAGMYREVSEDLDPEGMQHVTGEEGAIWPEDLEPEAFEIPPGLEPPEADVSQLDAYDSDDEDENVTSAAKLEEMLRGLGIKSLTDAARRATGHVGQSRKGEKGAKSGRARSGSAKSGGAKNSKSSKGEKGPDKAS